MSFHALPNFHALPVKSHVTQAEIDAENAIGIKYTQVASTRPFALQSVTVQVAAAHFRLAEELKNDLSRFEAEKKSYNAWCERQGDRSA